MCYYSGPQDALYEKLGHAEVVQVQLDGKKTQQEMERFADVSLPCSACFALRFMVSHNGRLFWGTEAFLKGLANAQILRQAYHCRTFIVRQKLPRKCSKAA